MSKLNINKNEWLELVFEGKNKEYGAYQLRRDDGKTTMKAFFSALVVLTAISSLLVFMSSFKHVPGEETSILYNGTRVKLDNIHTTKPKTNEAVAPKSEPVKKNLPMAVVKEENATPEVPKNEDLPKTPSTNTSVTGTGSEPAIVGSNPEGPINLEPAEEPTNGIKTTLEVEKSPSFPGGIGEFLKLVGNRFVTPIEDEKIIKVLVYFVVEKDGSLSNITVPRSPGYGLDREAIRVLKSIKTKWEPGIYKGKPVRTSYSLPIVVKMQ